MTLVSIEGFMSALIQRTEKNRINLTFLVMATHNYSMFISITKHTHRTKLCSEMEMLIKPNDSQLFVVGFFCQCCFFLLLFLFVCCFFAFENRYMERNWCKICILHSNQLAKITFLLGHYNRQQKSLSGMTQRYDNDRPFFVF